MARYLNNGIINLRAGGSLLSNSSKMFPWDDIFKDKRVLAGACALSRRGLTTITPAFLQLYTNDVKFDGFSFGVGMYIYKPNLDYLNYVTPMSTNKNLLLPSRERAIVEYLLLEKWCDEGTLIEALKTYQLLVDDYTELYRVAEFYGLSADKLEYWMYEAETDEEV